MAIRGRLFKYIFSLILAFSILFLSIPSKSVADEADSGAGISAPVPDNFLYTGAATYSIPIEVPPGRKGIAPNLALTYSSYQKNGWLGVGWTLDMGSIQRSAKKGTYPADGIDEFVASTNGSSSELVLKTDWDSTCPTGYIGYGAKIEGGFSKYCYSTSSGWIVTTKDGTKYYYGEDIGTRQTIDNKTFKWALDKVQDTNGNYMTIAYDTIGHEIYLARIDYTGNIGLAPSNSVIFNRDEMGRNDQPIDKAGVGTAFLLKNIEVRVGAELVRKYELQYDYSPSTFRSLLKSVTRYGSDGDDPSAIPLPPITFTYTEMASRFDIGNPIHWRTPRPAGSAVNYVRNTNDSGTYRDIIDMNGDNLPDRVTANGTSDKTYLNVYLNTGSGFSETAIQWTTPNVKDSWVQYPHSSIKNDTDITNFVKQSLIDMNGDSFPDRVTSNSSSDGDLQVFLNDYPNNSNGFKDIPNSNSWSTPQISAWDRDVKSINRYGLYQDIFDMDGDGLPDRVTAIGNNTGCMNQYNSNNCLLVFHNNGAGFSYSPTIWRTLSPDFDWKTYPQTQSQDNPPNIDQAIIDLNGDGLPDRVAAISNANGDLRVYLNTGSGFSTSMLPWTTPIVNEWLRFVKNIDTYGISQDIIDINGDGLPDRITARGNSTLCSEWYGDNNCLLVYPNTGSSFSTVPIPWQIPPYPAGASDNWRQYPQNSNTSGVLQTLIDMNGDGLLDRVTKNPDNDEELLVYLSPGPFPDLLRTIKNGIGGKTTIAYAPSTKYSNHRLPFIMQVVDSMTADDGNGNVSTTRYDYSDGYYDNVDREFRGFEKVVRINPDGTTGETLFHQDDTFKGLPYQTIARDSSGKDYSKTINSYRATSDTNFPYLEQQESYLYDETAGTKHTKTVFGYDSYGNITAKKFHGDIAVSNDKKTECIDYYIDSLSYWLVSLVKKTALYSGIQDCQNPQITAMKAKSEFEYYQDGKGNLQYKKAWLKDEWGTDSLLTTTYVFDDYGNQTYITSPKYYGTDTKTHIEYDTATQTYPVTVTNALNQASTTTYDYKFGKPLTKTDFNGNTTSYGYDKFGRISRITNPNDIASEYGTSSYAYNGFGYFDPQNLYSQHVTVCSTEQSGTNNVLCKSTYFDGFGRTIKTVAGGPDNDGKLIVTETVYDQAGRIQWASFPYYMIFESGMYQLLESRRWTLYEYDVMGRPWKVTPPSDPPASTTKAYSLFTTTTVDANGHKKEEEKDAYGRLVKIREYVTEKDANGVSAQVTIETSYGYDELNNLTSVTRPKDNTNNVITSITYDTLSRKTSMNDPDMGHWAYTYDANGNLETQTDAKLQKVYFQYDEINRLKQKDYETKKTLNSGDVVYFYDQPADQYYQKGRLTKVVDPSGNTQFYYDKLGQVTKTVKTVGATAYTIDTAYDAMGRTSSITYPDTEVIRYQYNSAGALYGVTNDAGNYIYAKYTRYNAVGQAGRVTYGNSVYSDYIFDPIDGRLNFLTTTSLSGTIQDLSYDYDNIGNITHITDNLDMDANVSPSTTAAYDYTTNINCQYPLLHHGPHAVTKVGTDNYCYDANGNMVSGGGRTITYNYDNMPVQIQKGGSIETLVYDYSGQRVMKNGTVYIGNLYECINSICKKHIFAGGRRIATKVGYETYYYHGDHLGSTSVVTYSNPYGSRLQNIKYFSFGEERYNSGDIGIPYKYTGQEEDPEIGLYYYNARYYDPALGMFISADSIVPDPGDPQAFNRYSYVLNNPLRYTDPTGHFVFPRDFLEYADTAISAVLAFAASGGNPVAAMAAAGSNVFLSHTGEGRKLTNVVAKYAFDNFLGLPPELAYMASDITLTYATTYLTTEAYNAADSWYKDYNSIDNQIRRMLEADGLDPNLIVVASNNHPHMYTRIGPNGQSVPYMYNEEAGYYTPWGRPDNLGQQGPEDSLGKWSDKLFQKEVKTLAKDLAKIAASFGNAVMFGFTTSTDILKETLKKLGQSIYPDAHGAIKP